MPAWTISIFREKNAINDIVQEWLCDTQGETDRCNLEAALDAMLTQLAGLSDWSVLNEGKKRSKWVFRVMGKECEGLSRIAFNANGKHQRLIGCEVSRTEYVILECGTKDRRGDRNNPGFYPAKCHAALERKQLALESKEYRHEFHSEGV